MDAYTFWRGLEAEFKELAQRQPFTVTWFPSAWNDSGDHYRFNAPHPWMISQFKVLAESAEVRAGSRSGTGSLWARWLDRIRRRGLYCTTGTTTSSRGDREEYIVVTALLKASQELCRASETAELASGVNRDLSELSTRDKVVRRSDAELATLAMGAQDLARLGHSFGQVPDAADRLSANWKRLIPLRGSDSGELRIWTVTGGSHASARAHFESLVSRALG